MADVIGFDPVAWAVDGGRLPADLWRLEAYANSSGNEGIVAAGDCKVHQLSTAGTQIIIDPGALKILNRSANVRNQIYVANGRNETRLDTPAQTTAARSHLVVVRMRDPQYAPWVGIVGGADPATFQYSQPYIIQNVPAGTKSAAELNLGYSALALARIDQPANTANITDAHIVDLRKVANPLTKRVVKGLNNDSTYTLFYADMNWHDWPVPANWNIEIPSWATNMVYSVALGQIIPVYQGVASGGYLRLNVGNGAILGDSVQWEVDAANATNPQAILNADEYVIPANLRGTTTNFKLEARRTFGTADIRWHPVSSLFLDITFEQRAV